MAIFKNFPKVSTLVRENILDDEVANIVYRFNRLGTQPAEMVKALEAAGYPFDPYLHDLASQPNHQFKRRKFLLEVVGRLGVGFHGLEYKGRLKRLKCDVYALNAGDLYATTLVGYMHNDGTVLVKAEADIRGFVVKDKGEF